MKIFSGLKKKHDARLSGYSGGKEVGQDSYGPVRKRIACVGLTLIRHIFKERDPLPWRNTCGNLLVG